MATNYLKIFIPIIFIFSSNNAHSGGSEISLDELLHGCKSWVSNINPSEKKAYDWYGTAICKGFLIGVHTMDRLYAINIPGGSNYHSSIPRYDKKSASFIRDLPLKQICLPSNKPVSTFAKDIIYIINEMSKKEKEENKEDVSFYVLLKLTKKYPCKSNNWQS
jgi:hypothetical protein